MIGNNSATAVVIFEPSPHCVERYVQHFRPCLSFAAAREELIELSHTHGVFTYHRPRWVVPMGSGDKCHAWIVVGDDLAMPIIRADQGRRLIAKTCIAKGCISHAERERRRARRRARPARRRRGRRP